MTDQPAFRKYAVLVGILAAFFFLFLATVYYPGGSLQDAKASGFDWQHNYLSHLFPAKAVNDAENAARPWAVAGMLLLMGSFALCFHRFAKKIPQKGAAKVVRYAGVGAMLFMCAAVTPYHDALLPLAIALMLLTMFYVTVFLFRSDLHVLKALSAICMLMIYGFIYLHSTRSLLEILPVVQKVSLGLITSWVLALEYFTTGADFQPVAAAGSSKN